jgi:hypothetical protein
MTDGYFGKRIGQGLYYWHCMLSCRQDEGVVDLPLSTESSESVHGKVGCVGDHLG